MSPLAKAQTVRKTGRRVRMMDSTARLTIKSGGLAVLVAMCGIMIFLVASAAPLFEGASVQGSGPDGTLAEPHTPLVTRLINGADHALMIDSQGVLLDVALATGNIGARIDLLDGSDMSSFAFEPGRWRVTMGTEDGQILSRTIDSQWKVVSPESASLLAPLAAGELRPLDDPDLRERLAEAMNLSDPIGDTAYLEAADDGRVLLWQPQVTGVTSIELNNGDGPVVRVASAGIGSRRRFLAAVRADGTGVFGVVRSVVRLDGSGATDRLAEHAFDLGRDGAVPQDLFVLADGSGVIALWDDGTFSRFDTRDPDEDITLAETGRFVPDERQITASIMALGGQTLLVGDNFGGLSAWLVADDPGADTADQRRLTRRWMHTLGSSPIVSIASGDRDRTAAVTAANGTLSLIHMTSEKKFASFHIDSQPVTAVASPSEELVLGLGADGSYQTWHLQPGHPGVSWTSLFGKVHYEGYAKPEWVYQSTGDAAAEPKYSVVPLIFGTIKATFFAMLFATPLAVLAAIYASEFMHRSIHRVVKPSIELMASLPSVVIGFVAAMVVAPFVREWLASIMVGMLVLPLVAVTAGMLWQTVPPRYGRKLGRRSQLIALSGVLLAGVVLSVLAGPLVEQTLFRPSQADALVRAGFYEPIPLDDVPLEARSSAELSAAQTASLRRHGVYMAEGQPVRPTAAPDGQIPEPNASIERWLDGNFGNAWPGWFIAMMVPAALVVPLLHAKLFSRRWIEMLDGLARPAAGSLEMARLLSSILAVIVAAAAAGWLLQSLGFDPRDSIFGRFTQKNTLVVGIVMGFAVIPIIFTLSEDALASVPGTLRSASLGTGATPWQTAVRVVLPVAGSGIFSACMIGLGRAVGETMIVLMATGNTPEMDLNIFSGFRSLSANIAVEMPEAPRDSTHFRVLFLCGLVLFVMTLVINTSAEVVRQHFRKRNAAL